jgi:hypothetical protein
LAKITIEEMNVYLADANFESLHGTERGAVLVWVSILDDLLERIIREFIQANKSTMDELFGANKPFGTFSSRINVCNGLALIAPDEAAALHRIRKIRNEFAHAIGMSLKDDDLTKKCRTLYDDLVLPVLQETIDVMWKGEPRGQFQSACAQMMLILYHRLADASKDARTPLVDPRPLADRV